MRILSGGPRDGAEGGIDGDMDKTLEGSNAMGLPVNVHVSEVVDLSVDGVDCRPGKRFCGLEFLRQSSAWSHGRPCARRALVGYWRRGERMHLAPHVSCIQPGLASNRCARCILPVSGFRYSNAWHRSNKNTAAFCACIPLLLEYTPASRRRVLSALAPPTSPSRPRTSRTTASSRELCFPLTSYPQSSPVATAPFSGGLIRQRA